MNLVEISEKLKNLEGIFPGELSIMRGALAAEYYALNDQLMTILMKKPEAWQKIRYSGEVKSDTAAERAWQRTEEGKLETILRMQLKMIEKMSAAVKTRIDVLIGESHNQF